jgi:ribonuclease HII
MSSKLPKKALKPEPDFSLETETAEPVCGIDEVGRGPLAGPVVAACVYIPDDVRDMDFIAGIKDSKKLSPARLEQLFDQIQQHCHYSVAEITPAEIDEINIFQASLKAMAKAYLGMKVRLPYALIDGKFTPDIPCQARAVIKGDNVSKSIAAASIIAKVTRDRYMHKLHQAHPHYGWERNVGYPTKEHMEAINMHGITEHHRKSFGPVKNFLLQGTTQKAAVSAA